MASDVTFRAATTLIDEQRTRIVELEQALRPFAGEVEVNEWSDKVLAGCGSSLDRVTVGDCRRARDVLKRQDR